METSQSPLVAAYEHHTRGVTDGTTGGLIYERLKKDKRLLSTTSICRKTPVKSCLALSCKISHQLKYTLVSMVSRATGSPTELESYPLSTTGDLCSRKAVSIYLTAPHPTHTHGVCLVGMHHTCTCWRYKTTFTKVLKKMIYKTIKQGLQSLRFF